MFKMFMHTLCHCFLLLLLTHSRISTSAVNDIINIHVGVILNLDSKIGLITNASVAMSHHDFYSQSSSSSHPRSIIVLHVRNSRSSTLGGASAALDLISNVKAKALIAWSTDQEAELVAQIANQSGVPLIFLSPATFYINPHNHNFSYLLDVDVRDSSQAKAISSLIKARQSNSNNGVTLLHHYSAADSSFMLTLTATLGNDGIPFTRLAVDGPDVTQTLKQLAAMKTGVVVLHVSFSLAMEFFKQAHDMGLTASESHRPVWILTAGVGNLLSFMQPAWAVRSGIMQEVFAMKNQYWRQNTETNKKLYEQGLIKADHNVSGMDIYSLWAYDALQILAGAVERTYKTGKESGQQLLDSILSSRNISSRLIRRRPNQRVAMEDAFEIFKIVNKDWRLAGYWDPACSLSFHNSSQNQGTLRSRTSRRYMMDYKRPNGRRVARKLEDELETSEVLNILVPNKTAYNEFVNQDNTTKKPGGFCIEVFNMATQNLTWKLRYTVYQEADDYADYYDDLVDLIAKGKYDALVGDLTITAKRSRRVDFSQPYMSSDIVMVVQGVDENDTSRPFWFFKPFSNDLWGAIIAFLFLKGVLLWVFETPRHDGSFRAVGKLDHLKKIFSMSFLISPCDPDSERIESQYSKLINILWMVILFMLAAGYSSNLTSMLTVESLQPTVTDLRALIASNDHIIGFQQGAFIRNFLLQMGARPQQLRGYSTAEEYVTALKHGQAKNGCTAIVDELPYVRVYLKDNPDFIIAGSYYHTGGFGFVFGKGSKWLSQVSEGVLNVTQNTAIMCELERKVFANDSSCAPKKEMLPVSYTKLTLSSYKYPFLFAVAISSLLLIPHLVQLSLPYKAVPERDYGSDDGSRMGGEYEHAGSIYVTATDGLSPASTTRILTRASTF